MHGERIHLVGIGGVGMAGLAVLLKAAGHSVSGCDMYASPRTQWLKRQGIRVAVGHSSDHLENVDELIITPAVARDNPEVLAWGKRPLRFRGEVLAELVSARDSIAVCGSHGKTTTSTWIARLLLALGEDVAWCIGGETGDFPVAKAGTGPLVVEADESDGTLAFYRARTLVVTNCEYDHPDHFKTETEYRECYDVAMRQAETVIESERLERLSALDATLCGLAEHNLRNARTAVEVALRRGHSLSAIVSVLPGIVSELPDRRFQRLAAGVYADYAHHPTEMKCAISMARQICRGRLRVLFQPHRYSRTKALLPRFPAAFGGADEVILCPTYSAFEAPIEGGDVADIYAEMRKVSQVPVYLARNCEEAWEHARNSMSEGDVTLILGAGDIIRLAPIVMRDIEDKAPRKVRQIWIGHGSNTWKSDLKLNVEYVRTKGPADAPGSSLAIPWMAGIPGTIGGWVKMNAGAFGHSISEVINRVKVDGVWRTAAECGFSYRHSNIEGEIQEVEFHPFNDSDGLSASEYLARRHKFPPGTFGSFFKNPSGDSAGRLLESVGAKDMRVGGAYVWKEHANVIVRGEGATPSDVLALAQLMRIRVKLRLGISLEPEVRGIEFECS